MYMYVLVDMKGKQPIKGEFRHMSNIMATSLMLKLVFNVISGEALSRLLCEVWVLKSKPCQLHFSQHNMED